MNHTTSGGNSPSKYTFHAYDNNFIYTEMIAVVYSTKLILNKVKTLTKHKRLDKNFWGCFWL